MDFRVVTSTLSICAFNNLHQNNQIQEIALINLNLGEIVTHYRPKIITIESFHFLPNNLSIGLGLGLNKFKI